MHSGYVGALIKTKYSFDKFGRDGMVDEGASRQAAHRLTQEQIAAFLHHLREKGRSANSLQKYKRDLNGFFAALPPDKLVGRDTLPAWRAELQEQGYAPRTINSCVSEANSLLDFLGWREAQLTGRLEPEPDPQPELTREEYLRLLSAAREMGNERTYLLVKVFAVTGIPVHELPGLTVEAVEVGRLELPGGRSVAIPKVLSRELAAYSARTGIYAGPVFVTRNRRPLTRMAVTAAIQALAGPAQVAPEKCNPRCLRRLHQATLAHIEAGVRQLVERDHERLLEREQRTVGWEEVRGRGP